MKPVLYVSHSKRGSFYYNDASARYRCVFPAEELISKGEQAHAIHFSQISKVTLSDYKKITFHRPQYSIKLFYIVKKAQKKGIELWVDFDDLLFCPELSYTSAAVQSGKMSASLAKKHAISYLKALQLFSNIQVSTDELASRLILRVNKEQSSKSKQNYNIKVTYNKVPERWVKQAKVIPAEERLKKKIIRYLPGTSHHKHDFAHVEKFLANLLQENKDYYLNIIGDLEFDTTLFSSQQVSQTDFQPFEQLPRLINDSWIIIAPLVDNVFNNCKSGLKFWESGIFGIPVISSPLRDIERFKNKGLCISDNIEEWKHYIHLLENPSEYEEASKQAKEVSEKSVFIQSDKNNNYRPTYLALTAEFGPRWPGDLINPISKKYKCIASEYKKILNKNQSKPSYIKESLLEEAANKSISTDLPPVVNKTLRKAKKFISSPKQFFKDSKLF